MFKKSSVVYLFLFLSLVFNAQETIKVEGLIVDKDKYPVPYAAVSILSKSIGTASNDDGGFVLKLIQDNLKDSITVSALGFKTFTIKVEDFIGLDEKIITLVEDVVSLDEITLVDYKSYVKDALKNLKNTTQRKGHQLNILYRRFSNENGTSRFLVEHYLKVYDRGPTSSEFEEIEVAESRKSNDYRFAKKKQKFHAAVMIAKQNPLRKGIYRNDYKWEVIDDTSYDGEDVIVVEGKQKENPKKWIKLYIGVDTKGIYKLENYNLKAVYK
ncbi:MAG: carboxypeptidase-like regulatory domain-containing protein [Polaribacter sp.]|nr:carboxypeptidase-like regulatory domain-containing protein [Polaribacter sp.]